MADLFRSELQQLESDTDMRALIVTGEGRAFSAGGDYQFIEDRMAGTVEDNAKVSGCHSNIGRWFFLPGADLY